MVWRALEWRGINVAWAPISVSDVIAETLFEVRVSLVTATSDPVPPSHEPFPPHGQRALLLPLFHELRFPRRKRPFPPVLETVDVAGIESLACRIRLPLEPHTPQGCLDGHDVLVLQQKEDLFARQWGTVR